MSAQGHLYGRRKPAQLPAPLASRNNKRRLRHIILCGNCLQSLIRQIRFQRHDASLIALKCFAGKRINLKEWKGLGHHFLLAFF